MQGHRRLHPELWEECFAGQGQEAGVMNAWFPQEDVTDFFLVTSHTGREVKPRRLRSGLGAAGPIYDVGSLFCGMGSTSGASRRTPG